MVIEVRARRPSHVVLLVLRRRWAGLAGIGLAVAFAVLLPDAEWVGPAALILATAGYPVSGLLRGQLRGRNTVMLQLCAAAGFAGFAICAVALGGSAGRYLLAATWFAHGVWDVAHHRADRMVPRWYAEACAVIDLLTAFALITLP